MPSYKVSTFCSINVNKVPSHGKCTICKAIFMHSRTKAESVICLWIFFIFILSTNIFLDAISLPKCFIISSEMLICYIIMLMLMLYLFDITSYTCSIMIKNKITLTCFCYLCDFFFVSIRIWVIIIVNETQ